MTREEAKELLPFIQAFAEGKTIQVWANDTWKDENYPFFGTLYQFRIKPEPNYRPFKTKEECWEEILKHQPFGWIKDIHTQCLHNIISIGHNKYDIEINSSVMYFDTAFNDYSFVDGTPFGIKEE